MANNSELTRAARHLMECHGARALQVAERRAQSLLQGELTTAAVTWRNIANTVRALQADTRGQ